MKTIVLQEPGRFALTDTAAPGAPAAGHCRVRIRRVGICGTDIHAYHGRQPFFSYPRILGHELGVEVVELGPEVEGIAVGDRCAVLPYLHCGRCIACRRGRTNCCERLAVLGVHLDGGMREELELPVATLFPANDLPVDALALVETLGIGRHAVRRAAPVAGECALVHGAGPIGLTAVQFLQSAGARIAVADVDQGRLDFCARHFAVERCIRADREEVEPALRAWADGELPTLVCDATGNQASMESCFARCAPGGRIVFVGLRQGSIAFDDPDFHRRELTLLASRNATAEDFADILQQMRDGRIDVASWITHRSGVERFVDDFRRWQEGDETVIKGMLDFD